MADVIVDVLGAGNGMQMTLPAVNDTLPSEVVDAFGIEVPVALETRPNPGIATLADGAGALAGHFLYDFYYRIWVIPLVLRAQNPVFGVPIPFAIWNAYPQPATNTLNTITPVTATGLLLDIAETDALRAVEYKVVNVTITEDADANIDAFFTFAFDLGEGTLHFIASIADFVQMVPDPPVVEEWAWLTDVMQSHNASEQRIALRGKPRRNIQYTLLIENEAERRRQYHRWYKSLATRIILPYYQYATQITAPSSLGSSTLYFDPARTDLRDGDYAIVYNMSSEEGFLVKIDTMAVDGASLVSPLTTAVTSRMIVAPAYTSRLANKGGIEMSSVTGTMSINADQVDTRYALSRPGSTAVIATYNSIPVLDRRPLAQNKVDEAFDVNYEVLDNSSGLTATKYSWPHPFVSGSRQFLAQRLLDPGELDWWRDFLSYANGRQNPFLLPTWREDVLVATAPSAGSTQLDIQTDAIDYVGLYYPYETYKRFQIATANGLIYRKVTGAVDNGDGTSTLTLDQPFGSDPEDVDISMISYLNLARLNSDRVKLSHGAMATVIELDVRSIDA